MLSANQIYKQVKPDIGFTEWLDQNNKEYHQSGTDLKPAEWMNKKYTYVGSDSSSINNIINGVVNFLGDTQSKEYKDGLAKQEAEALAAKNSKKILGLDPIAFYSVSGVLLVVAGIGVYYAYKKLKK